MLTRVVMPFACSIRFAEWVTMVSTSGALLAALDASSVTAVTASSIAGRLSRES